MFKGIIFALAACFIWGLIFVVPQFMTGFTSFEVALGRYTLYGLVSSLIFFKDRVQGACRHPLSIWMKALLFSLLCTFGYYVFLVLSLRHASPAICALILGISPITIAFYGNWQQKEISFRSLIIPSVLIFTGLVIINVPHLIAATSTTSYLLGIIFSLISLSIWSWYVVANSRFLKHHPSVNSSDWSTLIGVSSLLWVVIFTIVMSVFFEEHLQMQKFFTFNEELSKFFIGSAILGFLCSWLGAFLWNHASLHLPVSLAGQLTIFETIFGVLFVYIISQNSPTFSEALGITILLSAVIYGVRVFSKKQLVVH